MHVLLSNDDGIDGAGLRALEAGLSRIATVWTVAPDSERSAQSHALTLSRPLRVREVGPRRWAVSGTPADCVYLAVHHLLERSPALVVSGINDGANLGNDVHYSGTVAAAREACLHGLTAVSVSLHREHGDSSHWSTAVEVALRVVREAVAHPPPKWVHLNVNVPNVAPDALRGLRVGVLGRRTYAPLVDQRMDHRGRRYYWIGGAHLHFEPRDDTDGAIVERGYAAITPLAAYPTHAGTLERLRSWTDG